jgi:recombination protein RecA
VVKNKVAPPFREAEFDIIYGKGISLIGEILDKAVDANIIEKSGSWFSYDSNRLGQGRENARRFLEENEEVREEILHKVRVELGMEPGPEEETPAPEPAEEVKAEK